MSADTRLELLQDEGGGPIQRYKEKFGGGIHHIAFKVDSVEDYFNYFKTENIQLISEEISYGAGGHKIFLVYIKQNINSRLFITEGDGQPVAKDEYKDYCKVGSDGSKFLKFSETQIT